jgi:hypothetical protein
MFFFQGDDNYDLADQISTIYTSNIDSNENVSPQRHAMPKLFTKKFVIPSPPSPPPRYEDIVDNSIRNSTFNSSYSSKINQKNRILQL